MWAMSINYNLPLESSQASNHAELAAGQGCAGRITRCNGRGYLDTDLPYAATSVPC